MADKKFLDFTRANEVPLTDYVLISNATNGVRKATIDNVKTACIGATSLSGISDGTVSGGLKYVYDKTSMVEQELTYPSLIAANIGSVCKVGSIVNVALRVRLTDALSNNAVVEIGGIPIPYKDQMITAFSQLTGKNLLCAVKRSGDKGVIEITNITGTVFDGFIVISGAYVVY